MVSLVISGAMKIDPDKWTKDNWEKYKIIIDATKELDEELGQPDCIEPEKDEWFELMEKHFDR